MRELSTDWKRRFRRRLRSWYRNHGRALPWRNSPDPYRVWVSEIMLQQTQVATVRDYFTRFVARFPTVEALAAARETDVLRHWEGLGYYRRARQMHAAAQVIVHEFGGAFPADPAALQKLPGIGRYTAGAIASIAFNRAAPILEANTERLFARLIGYEDPPGSTAGRRTLWSAAESLVPRSQPGEFNQALMELGSLVCTPREPSCQKCPVRALCAAHRTGRVDRIPPPKPRKVYENVHEGAVVIRRNGRFLLRQCGPDERWAGLWDFPRVSLDPQGTADLQERLAERVGQQFGTPIVVLGHVATIKHGVTRFRITLDCYLARLKESRLPDPNGRSLIWMATRELAGLPLSTTGRKLARLVSE